jgi:hypothetical protein
VFVSSPSGAVLAGSVDSPISTLVRARWRSSLTEGFLRHYRAHHIAVNLSQAEVAVSGKVGQLRVAQTGYLKKLHRGRRLPGAATTFWQAPGLSNFYRCPWKTGDDLEFAAESFDDLFERRDLHIGLFFRLGDARLLDAERRGNLALAFAGRLPGSLTKSWPSSSLVRLAARSRVFLVVVRRTNASNAFAILFFRALALFLEFRQMFVMKLVGLSPSVAFRLSNE